MNRDAFLDQVRTAVRLGAAYRIRTEQVDQAAAYVGASGELAASLAAEIRAVGGEARVVHSREEAQAALRVLLDKLRPRAALCWRHPLLERLSVRALLQQQGVTAHDYDSLVQQPPDQQRRRCLEAQVGITSVDLAVAETGSLVVGSQPGRERMASLLPAVHVAIVETSQIVPDLIDVFRHWGQAGYDGLASNVAFVTGPSKTGDIELQLTTGVHGPGRWHVLILDEASRAAGSGGSGGSTITP